LRNFGHFCWQRFHGVLMNGGSGAVFTQYCVTCHNAAEDSDLVWTSASFPARHQCRGWGKVVLKLRTKTMPPAGASHPDQATYDAAASLESELDRASLATPRPGKLPLLHH
jgi:hypothetical protein